MPGLPHRTTFSTFSSSFLGGDFLSGSRKTRGERSLPSGRSRLQLQALSSAFFERFLGNVSLSEGAGPGPVPPHRRRAGSPGGLGPRAPGAPCGPGPAPPSAAGSPPHREWRSLPFPAPPGPSRPAAPPTPSHAGGRAGIEQEGGGRSRCHGERGPPLPPHVSAVSRPAAGD